MAPPSPRKLPPAFDPQVLTPDPDPRVCPPPPYARIPRCSLCNQPGITRPPASSRTPSPKAILSPGSGLPGSFTTLTTSLSYSLRVCDVHQLPAFNQHPLVTPPVARVIPVYEEMCMHMHVRAQHTEKRSPAKVHTAVVALPCHGRSCPERGRCSKTSRGMVLCSHGVRRGSWS